MEKSGGLKINDPTEKAERYSSGRRRDERRMLRDDDGTRRLGSTSSCLAERRDAKLHGCFRAREKAKGLSKRGVMCRRGSEEADLDSCLSLPMLSPFRIAAQ